jgi:hypothetical protein
MYGNQDSFFLKELADCLPVFAIHMGDDRRVILLDGTDIRQIAGPHVPKVRSHHRQENDQGQEGPNGQLQKKSHLPCVSILVKDGAPSLKGMGHSLSMPVSMANRSI